MTDLKSSLSDITLFAGIGGAAILLGLFSMRAFSTVRRRQPSYWLALPGLLAVIVVAGLCGWISNNWTSPLVGVAVFVVLFVMGTDAQAWWMGTRLWEGALALLAAEARVLFVILAISLPTLAVPAVGLMLLASIVVPGTTIPLFALLRKAFVCWRKKRGSRAVLSRQMGAGP